MQRKGRYFYANGKRKTSVARVRLYEKGKGDIIVNNKPIEEYFFGTLIGNIKSPLKLANAVKMFDITVKVVGGGVSSQSDAVRHGIAKALLEFDPELRSQLKKAGLLTRDSRTKERKKFGLKRARRAPQWAKR
ncbi:30S ribosomal protein S9 [Patescibacteria group bacterium]|nr:30S ribosomal protein S9 [Patescibacteria group bacterium]MBU1682594.1 30S ribosomal protein S9 [Patescibacteria group bacterium]MBU1935667.1 30S ribosomal protein S9 [Patescibacteria group bacterium]